MPALNEHENGRLYPLKIIKSKRDYAHALRSLESVFDETKGRRTTSQNIPEPTSDLRPLHPAL